MSRKDQPRPGPGPEREARHRERHEDAAIPTGGYRENGHGYSDLGSGQGFGSQDYSRNEHYTDDAPGGRGMGGNTPTDEDPSAA